MKTHNFIPTFIIVVSLVSLLNVACGKGKSAIETVEPVKQWFESQSGKEFIPPGLDGIENTSGTILTWRESGSERVYSWALAKNTDDLKKALIFFDSAQSWNTEEYIFLPITNSALEVHTELGLKVPQSIYDEDGMDRIEEMIIEGKVPEGSFVDQFDQFYGE